MDMGLFPVGYLADVAGGVLIAPVVVMAGGPVAVLVVFVFVAELVHFLLHSGVGDIVIHPFVKGDVAVSVELEHMGRDFCAIGLPAIHLDDVPLFVVNNNVYTFNAFIRIERIANGFWDVVAVVV